MRITLRVRKSEGAPQQSFTFDKPTSLSDPLWSRMVTKASDLNELAWQQWRIKWQGAFRTSDTAPSEYRYGGGAAPTVIRLPQNAFEEDQWAILEAQHSAAGAILEPVEGSEADWAAEVVEEEEAEDNESEA